MEFVTRDSGDKAVYADGMQRDTSEGKPKFGLMFPKGVAYEDQLLTRVAGLYARGGEKYGDRNWEKSSTEESLAHHEEAFWRHAVKFFLGVNDGEDHAAAVVWNINAIELTRRNVLKNQIGEIEVAKAAVQEDLAAMTFTRDLSPVIEGDGELPPVMPDPRWETPLVALQDAVGDIWEPHDDGTWSCWFVDRNKGVLEWTSPYEEEEGTDQDFFYHTTREKMAAIYGPMTEIFEGEDYTYYLEGMHKLPWE
jgi:hypothetical protein